MEKARKLISGIDSKQLIMNIDVEIATGKMGEGLMYSSPERIKEGLDGVKKLLKKFKYDCRVVEGNVY